MRISLRALLLSALAGLGLHTVQAAPFAYIPHDGGVTVIDIATHTAVKTIPLAGQLFDVAAQPGSTRTYIASSPIHVIDVRTQSETFVIPAGNAYSMALSPLEAKAVVLDDFCFPCSSTRVRIIDTESRGELASLTIAGTLQHIAFSTIRNVAYISDPTNHLVRVINMSTYAELPSIPLGGNSPRGMVAHPSANLLYVTLADLNVVRVINLENNSTVTQIPVGNVPTDIIGDVAGSRLYVVNTLGNSVSVIDTASHTVVATIPVALGPTGIDITPDDTFVYVVNAGARSVSVIHTPDLSVIAGVAIGNDARVLGRFIGGPSVEASPLPGILTGLFWNPNESGWGIHLTQRDNTIFAAFFTYGSEGANRWYTGSSCTFVTDLPCETCVEGAICNSGLTESHGPNILNEIFNPAQVTRAQVGNMRLRFHDRDAATFSYDVNGVSRQVEIQRQVFDDGLPPGHDYSDLWWNPAESGWGLGVTQQGDTMFLTWFVYDEPRNPVWYVASDCEVTLTGDGCTGRLYRVTGHPGPNFPDGTFDPSRVQLEDVGTVRLGFSDASNGVMDFVLHGVAGRKNITRQLF